MLLHFVFLIKVLCFPPQSFATSSSLASNSSTAINSSSVESPLSYSTTATVTIELPSSAFKSSSASSISPSTASAQNSQKASSSSANVKSQLEKALNELNKKTTPSGDPSSSGGNSAACDSVDWSSDNKCTDKKSCEAYLVSHSKKMNCLKNKPENVSSMELTENLEKAGMKIAEDLINQVKSGKPSENVTYNLVKEKFVIVCGVADDNYINNTKDEFLQVPSYSDPSILTGNWETMRDSISIPIIELKNRATSYWPYVLTVQSNLVEDRPLKMTEIETDYNEIIKESDLTDLYLDENNEMKSRKKAQNVYINTNVLSFVFKTTMKDLKNPVLITFRHKKAGSLENPSCVYWDKTHSIWSKKGLKVEDTNSTHTVCSSTHLSMFGVAMKEKNLEDLAERETLVVVAIVIGSISLLLLIASAVCIFFVGYHSVDNMKIALNIDLSLIFCHLFFFIGLSNEASKYLATPATCEVVAPFVHMFELAALSFLLMEGIYYRSIFKSVFSKKNTRTFYIYASLGWGIPVAFGSAVAGYTYQHHGSPFRNEFCWMSVYGGDAWYFGTPVLILALLNLMVRGVVLKDVMAWNGDPDDINIKRTKIRLITSIIFLPVIILTWILGVLATNHSEDRVYHYFFVVFHALQGFLFFVFYCARNTEMWDYYMSKKNKEIEQKNAVYHFQYVP